MARYKHFWEQLSSGLEIRNDAAGRRPLIEILGDQRVLVENHRGIGKYSCNEVCVSVDYGNISINGTHLRIKNLTNERLVVYGSIHSVILSQGRQ